MTFLSATSAPGSTGRPLPLQPLTTRLEQLAIGAGEKGAHGRLPSLGWVSLCQALVQYIGDGGVLRDSNPRAMLRDAIEKSGVIARANCLWWKRLACSSVATQMGVCKTRSDAMGSRSGPGVTVRHPTAK